MPLRSIVITSNTALPPLPTIRSHVTDPLLTYAIPSLQHLLKSSVSIFLTLQDFWRLLEAGLRCEMKRWPALQPYARKPYTLYIVYAFAAVPFAVVLSFLLPILGTILALATGMQPGIKSSLDVHECARVMFVML